TFIKAIEPGAIALINVEIENNADFAMRDVEVKLNFSDNIPLAPYQTTSQKQIDNIPSKSSETATFQVIALPNADPNVYRLPLHLTFDDELGNENTRQDYMGIIISKKPEYDLTIEDSALIKGINDKITVSLSNIGPSNIKYLIMEVLPSKNYEILSSPRTYIGNLEPDDYETAEFDFYPKKSGDILVNVRLEYKDDLNNPIIDIQEVQTYIYSQTRAKMIGLLPNKFFKNIFLILFIIFFYLSYKAWRTSRNIMASMKQAAMKMLVAFVKILRNLRWNYIKRIPRKIRIFFIKLK
ncbi:MAG: COG1361 S-layer family protein, partial [Candidatus Thorarchaeota archaeon]